MSRVHSIWNFAKDTHVLISDKNPREMPWRFFKMVQLLVFLWKNSHLQKKEYYMDEYIEDSLEKCFKNPWGSYCKKSWKKTAGGNPEGISGFFLRKLLEDFPRGIIGEISGETLTEIWEGNSWKKKLEWALKNHRRKCSKQSRANPWRNFKGFFGERCDRIPR